MSKKIKIAIITSRFNEEITGKLKSGAIEELTKSNITPDQYDLFDVPGAVEIPLIAKKCAMLEKYDAIICLGAVIRGETTHYDYVCEQVSWGCQYVALQCDVPVIFGVLTTENEEQALDRVGGAHGHKGHDAVRAAIEMIGLVDQL